MTGSFWPHMGARDLMTLTDWTILIREIPRVFCSIASSSTVILKTIPKVQPFGGEPMLISVAGAGIA